MESFRKQSTTAVKIIRKCSSHSDDAAKSEAITQVSGGAATAVGGMLVVVGFVLMPVTFGGSIALSVAGGTIGAVNVGAQVAASARKKSSDESDTKRVRDATTNVVHTSKVFEMFLQICLLAFDEVKQYIETKEGKEFVNMLQGLSTNSDNFDPRSVEQVLNFNVATDSMLQIVEFIKESNYEGFHTSSFGTKPPMPVTSTGTRAVSVALRSSLPTFGMLNIASGTRAIRGSGSEMSKKIGKFASDLETATKELLKIYTELTQNKNNDQTQFLC